MLIRSASGLRGIVKDDFSDEVVYSIGRAFGQILVANNQTKVSTSGDIRHSTKHLKNILSILIQLTVFPLFGLYPSFSENIGIALIFTVVSIIRSSIWRWIFRNA